MPIMVALATVPGRESSLALCLESLRQQLGPDDRIGVVCHDMTEPPACVLEYASVWVCEPDTRGSAAKLHWARSWSGLYLGCDDDWVYPPDFVSTMQRWVKRWKGKALVVGHGRILRPKSSGFLDASEVRPPRSETKGQWLNYPGCCALAFDTRLNVPDRVPGKNLEEVHLAVWAQRNKVPIWLVPHTASWLDYRLEEGRPTIWSDEKAAKFSNRNVVIQPHSREYGWSVYRA